MLIPPLDHQLDIPACHHGTIAHQNHAIAAFDLLGPDATMIATHARFAQELDEEGVLKGCSNAGGGIE